MESCSWGGYSIFRLNADGSPDQSFDPGEGLIYSQPRGYRVAAINTQEDGKIIIAGKFEWVDGLPPEEHRPVESRREFG